MKLLLAFALVAVVSVHGAPQFFGFPSIECWKTPFSIIMSGYRCGDSTTTQAAQTTAAASTTAATTAASSDATSPASDAASDSTTAAATTAAADSTQATSAATAGNAQIGMRPLGCVIGVWSWNDPICQ